MTSFCRMFSDIKKTFKIFIILCFGVNYGKSLLKTNHVKILRIIFKSFLFYPFSYYLLKAAKLNKSSTPGGSDSSRTEI